VWRRTRKRTFCRDCDVSEIIIKSHHRTRVRHSVFARKFAAAAQSGSFFLLNDRAKLPGVWWRKDRHISRVSLVIHSLHPSLSAAREPVEPVCKDERSWYIMYVSLDEASPTRSCRRHGHTRARWIRKLLCSMKRVLEQVTFFSLSSS